MLPGEWLSLAARRVGKKSLLLSLMSPCPPQLCHLTVSSGDLFSPLLLLVLLVSMALFSIALRCSTLPMPALNPGCFRRVSPSCWLCPRLHLFFFLVGFCKDAIPGSFLQCVWWCHGAALPARASAWSSEALPQPGGVSPLSHRNPVITAQRHGRPHGASVPCSAPAAPAAVFRCSNAFGGGSFPEPPDPRLISCPLLFSQALQGVWF